MEALNKQEIAKRELDGVLKQKEQVQKALMQKGRKIELVQMPKAESDIAVAAASIIARDLFLRSLRDMNEKYGMKIPKGASARVREVAVQLARTRGPEILMETVKCHFKTTDQVLETIGTDRSALGPDGQAVSKPFTGNFKRKKGS